MPRSPVTETRPRPARSRFKILLALVAAPAVLMAFTQWFACELTEIPALDMDDEFGNPVSPPPIADLVASPPGPLQVLPNTEFFIQVSAVDPSGVPIPDTEARIDVNITDHPSNPPFANARLQLVRLCGGNDDGVSECAGLVPAFHQFDNDGVMWAFFRLDCSPGECLYGSRVQIRFQYPRPDPDDVQNYTHTELVSLTLVDPATNPDSDGDGIPDSHDQCPGTPAGTLVDGVGCPPHVATDTDGDGVLDGADNCPAADNPGQENHDLDGLGDICDDDDDGDGTPDATDPCPLDPTDACHAGPAPTAADIAPGFYDFAKLAPTSFACGSTSVGSATWVEASLEKDHFGVDQPVIETLFGVTQLFTSVGGLYDPTTGEYLSSGPGSDGNLFFLNGFWTTDGSGNPFFDGTLTEDRASCQNVFPVTLTHRATNPSPGGHVVSVTTSRTIKVGETTSLDVKVFDAFGNLIAGSDPFVAATVTDAGVLTIVSKDEGTPGDGIVTYMVRGNLAGSAIVVYEYPGSAHDTTTLTVTP